MKTKTGKVDWNAFIKEYVSNPGHWYVSKIKEYSEASFDSLRTGLILLDLCLIDETSVESQEIQAFVKSLQLPLPGTPAENILSKKWNFLTQVYYTSRLDKESLISEMNRARVGSQVLSKYRTISADIQKGMNFYELLKKYGDKILIDYSANARNFVSFYKKLGFAWIEHDKGITISDAGYKFIDGSNTQELFEIQRIKLQIWNPTLPKDRYGHMRVLPYFFLLELLVTLKDVGLSPYLTKHEYALFVTKAKEMDEINRVANYIIAFRSLTDASKVKLERKLRSIKRKTKIRGEAKRSLYEELLDSAGKEIGFFTSNGLLKSVRIGNAEGLLLEDEAKTRDLIQKYQKDISYFNVNTEEEWFQYYGDTAVKPVIGDIIKHYSKAGNFKMVQSALKKMKDKDIKITEEIIKAQEEVLLEKEIEDYYEKHIPLILDNIKLVKNGRQYTTEIGFIDLLAVDNNGKYVVIELKREQADDDTIGQVLRYMGWVHINLADENRVLGIVLSQEITNKLKYARKGMQHPEINEILLLKKHPDEIIDMIKAFKKKLEVKEFDYEVNSPGKSA